LNDFANHFLANADASQANKYRFNKDDTGLAPEQADNNKNYSGGE